MNFRGQNGLFKSFRHNKISPLQILANNFRLSLNPQAPVAQKIADEVVFRRFQGEGVEFFFKSDLTDPPQTFDAFYSLFERMRLKRKKRCLFTLTNI